MHGISFPDIDPVLIQLGPFAIRWYALAYIAGLVLGWRYILKCIATPRLWNGPAPVNQLQIDDALLWAALGIILGGRIGYVLVYGEGAYLSNPMEIFAVWHGGMSFTAAPSAHSSRSMSMRGDRAFPSCPCSISSPPPRQLASSSAASPISSIPNSGAAPPTCLGRHLPQWRADGASSEPAL